MGVCGSKCFEGVSKKAVPSDKDDHMPGSNQEGRIAEVPPVVKTRYNPEWDPTGIEGGVDTNKLPWIPLPQASGCFYKPLRASHETGMFSLVCRMTKGTVQPDVVHLGSADFMVLSGRMTYPTGPMSGTLEAGLWGYVPAEAKISGLVADEDVEYVMNCYGPLAFLADDHKSVKSLFTCSDVRSASLARGITLIPSTLAECMQPRPAEYDGPAEALAISKSNAAALCTRAQGIADKSSSTKHPHYVDTKTLDWFESMPGVSLKILRVSEETGVVSVIVRHMATAPPHYHLGAADFMMLAGSLGYRAGPPEGYGPGTWFFEPAGARHESTQNVTEEETMYLANVYGPIQFDSGVGTPIAAVLSWMSYLQIAEACGAPLVQNVFPGDSTHLAAASPSLAPKEKVLPSDPAAPAPAASYNPEWNPTGIEGGVDANTLPWISFPKAAGCSYKPLRASRETGRFSLVVRMAKGTVQPDLVHLGAADFMVLSGKMTYPSGPMAGTLEAGVWGYVPAEARIFGLVADEDVEYLMNFYGPIAFLSADKKSVSSLFTCSDVRQAAAQRGITLIPSTLSECMQPRPAEYSGPGDPLAISADGAAALCTRATGIAKESAKFHPHYVDTKAMEWFESMPGVGLKILRVSEETGVVTAMVRHMATAPPHYHLGAADFMMLAGHLGYRAGPPEGYGPGCWFFEPAGARHESTQNVTEEETIYLANIYGPIQFDSGVGTPVVAVLSWMSYLQMAEASGATLVENVFPNDSSRLAAKC